MYAVSINMAAEKSIEILITNYILYFTNDPVYIIIIINIYHTHVYYIHTINNLTFLYIRV